MPARNETTTEVLEREVILTRVVDAPRELVWKAWTDAEHLPKWWGPNGFTTTIQAIDVRPGGVWRFIMHGPDGTDHPNEHVYIEIANPERLVYDVGSGDGSAPLFRGTVTFVEQGEKAKIIMRCTFLSAAALDEVKKFAIEGGQQHLERLANHLGTME